MAARREQLMGTALRLFAEHGFRGTTTRRIAEDSGVTEAVIFQHFPDKDALYAAILEAKAADPWAQQWFAELELLAAGADAAAVLRCLFAGIVDLHERDPYYLRLMVYSALEQHPLSTRLQPRSAQLYQLLERFIVRGQRGGRFREGPAPVLVRAVLALPIYHVMQRRLFKTPWPAVQRDELVDTGVRFALAGLARPSGEEARS
jgi:TetR/AcrR family transcriptional regulator